ncbi:MAG: FIST signal transduction protein [Vulcanimicrobiota bacterium]
MKLVTFGHSLDSPCQPQGTDLDSPQTLVLVFGAPEFRAQPEALVTLRARFPQSVLVGCSSSGEILGEEIHDKSLAVAVAHFEKSTLRSASTTVDGDSRKAARELAEQLKGPGLKGVLVLSDGLNVSGSELSRGFNEVLDGVVVTGGLAGDGDRFASTWVLEGSQPSSGRIVAVGFYGTDMLVGYGSRGGWDEFGLERQVTRAKGSVLYELDGKKALALYKEYLGELASELPASGLLFPLSLRRDVHDQQRFVRTILAVDEKAQSMTFAGEIPEGYLAQLMHANFDRLIDGAGEAANLARGGQLAIAISCVGRRLVLGQRAEEEVETAFESLPEGTQQVGFYSYGELSPQSDGKCALHNQTMTMTTLGER